MIKNPPNSVGYISYIATRNKPESPKKVHKNTCCGLSNERRIRFPRRTSEIVFEIRDQNVHDQSYWNVHGT